MTEQIEDDFWAQERARDTAARGRHADPSACGTCRGNVAAGGQVVHDECAQRAVLLPAPDAPGYELITGMTEEEVWALPARFHVPVFMESSTPRAWVCAVCWGDGWSTLWPCKTALDQGLRVFTADDYAETRAQRDAAELAEHRAEADTPLVVSRFEVAMEHALEEEPGLTVGAVAENGRPVAIVFDEETRPKVAGWLAPAAELADVQQLRAEVEQWRATYGRDALPGAMAQMEQMRARVSELEAELAAYRALDLGDLDGRVSATCDDPGHPTWLRRITDARGCGWCRAVQATAEGEQARAELAAEQERSKAGLRRADEHVNAMSEELKRYADGKETPVLWSVYNAMHLRAANAEAELKKYVGAEPTIAEEMAYLSRCLHTVHDLCDLAKQRDRATVTVAELELSVNGEWQSPTPRPALPWAHAMDDSDLHLFLDDLVSAALNRWQTDQDGPIPDRVTLAEIERACARWRTPGQGYRSDEPDSQPSTRAYPPALPWAALMDGEDLAGFLRDLDAGMRDAARQAHFAGRPQAPAVLTALEHACATWRLIAETQHAHNTAPGPDAETEGR